MGVKHVVANRVRTFKGMINWVVAIRTDARKPADLRAPPIELHLPPSSIEGAIVGYAGRTPLGSNGVFRENINGIAKHPAIRETQLVQYRRRKRYWFSDTVKN